MEIVKNVRSILASKVLPQKFCQESFASKVLFRRFFFLFQEPQKFCQLSLLSVGMSIEGAAIAFYSTLFRNQCLNGGVLRK